MLKLHTVKMLACNKCVRSTFKEPFGNSSDRFFVQRTDTAVHRPAICAVPFQGNNQFGVAEYWYIGIVSAHNKLARPLELAYFFDDALVDESVVEVVFGLIYY